MKLDHLSTRDLLLEIASRLERKNVPDEQQALHFETPQGPRAVRVIQARAAARYGITIDELLGPGREQHVAAARKEAMQDSRRLGLSYPVIGKLFNRDHTTVMAAVRGKRRA